MKGYKALLDNMTSKRGHVLYELDKWYEITVPIWPGSVGFHFCQTIEDIERTIYSIKESRIFEIETGDTVASEQNLVFNASYCTDKIRFVRELSKEEIAQYFKDNEEKLARHHNFFVKRATLEQGAGWDILSQDRDYALRRMLVKQGYNLELFLHDKDARVRAAVAEQEYGLQELAQDRDFNVRLTVANKRAELDTLVNDPDWRIRKIVAKYGYGLETLTQDENNAVKFAAKRKLEELRAGGYENEG